MADTWIAFSQNGIRDGRYLVGLETHEGRDEIYFSVPDGFFSHDDSVAAALTTLCGQKYGAIAFNFPVSPGTRTAIAERTKAQVSASADGTPRVPGRNLALNFSGGFDSLASHMLAPEQIRVAVAFGGWFKREADFFETLSPEIVCTTDFRQKGHERNDWMFMFAASLLYADYLDLCGVGLGTIFEATTYNFRTARKPEPMRLLEAVGLRDSTVTRGLTEFGTARVILHYAPEMIDRSILSLAAARSEKQLRKRLLIDATRHLDGGPPLDFDRYEYPKKKLGYGENFAIDFLALLFLRMYGPELVSRWMEGLDRVDVAALSKIDVGWIYRHNPLFLDDISREMQPRVMERMRAAGVEPFQESDWAHYRALRDLLSECHRFPA